MAVDKTIAWQSRKTRAPNPSWADAQWPRFLEVCEYRRKPKPQVAYHVPNHFAPLDNLDSAVKKCRELNMPVFTELTTEGGTLIGARLLNHNGDPL